MLEERKTFCIIISYNILGLNLLDMLKRVTSVIVTVTLILLAGSCVKDTLDIRKFSKEIEIDPGLYIPAGYGNLSVDDLLKRVDKNGYVKLDSGGLLYFAYSSN